MSLTANMMRRVPRVFGCASSDLARVALGLWDFVSSSRPLGWGPHHCDVDSDIVETYDIVHPTTLGRHLANQSNRHSDSISLARRTGPR